jgi:hypothetical protein
MTISTRLRYGLAVGTILLIAALLSAAISAQSGGGYDLSWSTIDGGGGVSAGSSYIVMGTVGQPDDAPAMSSADFRLAAGFWAGAWVSYQLYLPLVLRQ